MGKKYAILLLCLGAMLLTGCCTKKGAVNRLTDFRDDLRDNATEYSLFDWARAGKKYVKIEKKLLRHHYTNEEQRHIGELKGECATYATKAMAGNVAGKITNWGSQLKGLFEGASKAWEKDK